MQEALNCFIAFGPKHFNYLISEFVEHYHTEGPHQAVGNVPLVGDFCEVQGAKPDAVVYRTRLGGVLRHFEKLAA